MQNTKPNSSTSSAAATAQFSQMKFQSGGKEENMDGWRGQQQYPYYSQQQSTPQQQQQFYNAEPWSTAEYDGSYYYGQDYNAWGQQQQQGNYYGSPSLPDFSTLHLSDSASKKTPSWASIASQPAKPTAVKSNKSKNLLSGGPPPPIILNNESRWGAPPPVVAPQYNLAQSVWEPPIQQPQPQPQAQQKWERSNIVAQPVAAAAQQRYREEEVVPQLQQGPAAQQQQQGAVQQQQVEPKYPDETRIKSEYNPTHFDLPTEEARFFVIKSYSEDDIHRSIKYEIWCSTEHGNKRLDTAFRSRPSPTAPIYLFFSVNSSGHFCGMAEMRSAVDYDSSSSVWSQNKWKGQFKVKWIYVKDVPNSALRQIKLENNEGKSVTNSRDTQEVPLPQGRAVLRILHSFHHTTSIFDDFVHYEKRQEEEDAKKPTAAVVRGGRGMGRGMVGRHMHHDYPAEHPQQQSRPRPPRI